MVRPTNAYRFPEATDAELKSFDWLPLERWTVDTLFNYFKVEEGHLCKLCDKYERVSKLSQHVKDHRNARLALKKREKEEAQKRATEARKLRQEEKRRERESR
jgi:hypothetical protein